MKSKSLTLVIGFSGLALVKAFLVTLPAEVLQHLLRPAPQLTRPVQHSRRRRCRFLASDKSTDDRAYWLGEFATSTGELIQPYNVLGVSREASTEEIKKAYRTLSRKYHPDGMRHRTILPGSCNNVEEVREQWERIKLAYEILSRPQMRRRYDRKEFLADPAAAVQRAAVDAAVKGAVNVGKGIGKGLFQAGAFAFQQLAKNPQPKAESDESKVVESDSGSPAELSSINANEIIDEAIDTSETITLLTDTPDNETMGGSPTVSNTKGRPNTRGFARRRKKL